MTNIFVSINCDKEYHFNTIDEWLKNDIRSIINIHKCPNDPKVAIQTIIKQLIDLHDEFTNNVIDTHIIYRNDSVEYYLFTYNNKSDKTNTIISKLIDNSYQTTYDVNNQLMHDNKCVICKGDGKKMLDVDIDELMNIIKSSYLPTALIVDNETITNHYYRNNPVYGIDGYDIYTSLTYHNKELRIHLDSQTDIIYTDYCNVSFKNKDLYYGIFKKWNVLTENKYPLNIKLMISLHDNNVNINIDDNIKDDIIDFLINA